MSNVIMVPVSIDKLPKDFIAEAISNHIAKKGMPNSFKLETKTVVKPKVKRKLLRSDSNVYKKIQELVKHYGNNREAERQVGLGRMCFHDILNKKSRSKDTIAKIMSHKIEPLKAGNKKG